MIPCFEPPWRLYESGAYLLLPAVVGWNKRGRALMGKGLPAEAAARYPTLLTWWGDICRSRGAGVGVSVIDHREDDDVYRFILAPVVPLSVDHPEHSWRQKGNAIYMERTLLQLAEMPAAQFPRVGVPHLWEYAGLPQSLVEPMMKRHLRGDRWLLLEQRSVV